MEPRTSFIGRDTIVAEVADLIRTTTVVTLAGPGGIGKSRLSQRVATELAADATDGIFFAELAPLPAGASEVQVGEVVGAALGAPSLDAAWSALDDATTLLVLDNCEHVLESAAAVVERLIVDRPELRVLTTSREPLEVPGEHVVPLQPLDVDAALVLLVERAATAGAAVDLADPAQETELRSLCQQLDGLPLAVELAAPRLRSLGPGDVLAELQASADILRRRRGEHRHRSVHAAVEWSYDLLDEAEAATFRAASAFRDGFDLEELHHVLADATSRGETAELLDRLVVRSLVQVDRRNRQRPYRMLVPVRQVARTKALEAGEFEAAHRRWINHLVQVSGAMLARGAVAWDDDLIDEIFARADDLHEAGQWALTHDDTADRAFPLFLPMWATVHNSHIKATFEHGEALLARWPDPKLDWWPEIAALTATAAVAAGDLARAEELASLAIEAAPTPGLGAIVAQRALVLVRLAAGDFASAAESAEVGAAWATELGVASFAGHLANHRAAALLAAGDTAGARAIVADTDDRARDAATSALSGPALQVLAESHLDDDPAAGHDALDAIARVVGSRDLLAGRWAAQRVRGQLFLRQGEPERALTELRAALVASRRAGERRDMWTCLRWIGVTLALHSDEQRTAAALLRGAERNPTAPAPGAPGRDLLDEAVRRTSDEVVDGLPAAALVELALTAEVDRADPTHPDTAAAARRPPRLQLTERVARIEWNGEAADLDPLKGLRDIAILVAAPNREVHALALMGSTLDEDGTGPAIDEAARRAYEERLRDLHDDIAEAEDHNDAVRLESAQREFDEIVATLSAALGLGGRERKTGAAAEKARSAVTWRIRAAIKKVEGALPAAGRHLRVAIRTGGFCRYEPEEDPGWVVDTSGA